MAERKSSTAGEKDVQRSATVGVNDTTVDDITAAQALVGAPTTARVATGPGTYSTDENGTNRQDYPYSVTFTWSDKA